MTTYILTALLVALVVFSGIGSRGKQWGPWDLALIALLATSLWLIFVASGSIQSSDVTERAKLCAKCTLQPG